MALWYYPGTKESPKETRVQELDKAVSSAVAKAMTGANTPQEKWAALRVFALAVAGEVLKVDSGDALEAILEWINHRWRPQYGGLGTCHLL